MPLKAVKPEVVAVGKPKFLISGESGVGKTWFALDFPKPYYIDTEGGAVRQQYREKLAAVGGVYFGKDQGSQDFKSVIDEITELATTKHDYKTLVIDSFTHLYDLAASIAEETVGNEFGRDKKEANRPARQLIRWLENVDMTVILITHAKDKWVRQGKETVSAGTTFDGYQKLKYLLDLWMEGKKLGRQRSLTVRKTRIESLPEDKELPMEYQAFAALYGKEVIERASTTLAMATTEQVARIKELVGTLRLEEEAQKWMEKANVDEWVEMTEAQLAKCIEFCNKKLAAVVGTK